MKVCLTLFEVATGERIAMIPRVAGTNRVMIYDLTTCIDATCTRAWIDTFRIDACLSLAAIRADNTFWPTIRWRSNVAVYAG